MAGVLISGQNFHFVWKNEKKSRFVLITGNVPLTDDLLSGFDCIYAVTLHTSTLIKNDRNSGESDSSDNKTISMKSRKGMVTEMCRGVINMVK